MKYNKTQILWIILWIYYKPINQDYKITLVLRRVWVYTENWELPWCQLCHENCHDANFAMRSAMMPTLSSLVAPEVVFLYKPLVTPVMDKFGLLAYESKLLDEIIISRLSLAFQLAKFNITVQAIVTISEWASEWLKFNSLSRDSGQQGPYSPYKPCNHSLYIGITIFPHIDNTQSTGH